MTKPMIETTGVTRDTGNGGLGYERTAKGELFVSAVSSFASSPAGKGGPKVSQHSDRMRELVKEVALVDPAWVLRFDRWLRDEAHMRAATIEVACAFVHGRLEAGVKDETGPGRVPGLNRTAINVACLRADEPAAVIEHWRATYGRALPMPVKRGVADAVVRLYHERSALKYDGVGNELRMGDVIELTHPKAKDAAQGALFEYLINRRHGWKDSDYLFKHLPVVESAERLRTMDKAELRELLITTPAWLKDAGMTWENLSSLGAMDKDAWEAVIPTMGYMALLRNLRNFDSAEIGDAAVARVRQKLGDQVEVEGSRQLPFRFFSAKKAADPRWTATLEQALEYSLGNIPELGGRTLIMVDCSISMRNKVSDRSDMSRMEQAALFGTALAVRCEDPVLVRYGDDSERVELSGGVLQTVASEYTWMGGTETVGTVKQWLGDEGPFDRVVILTDEQANAYTSWSTRRRESVSDVVPADTMLYTWNLAGHEVAQAEATATSHSFAGLTDQCFKLIPLIESGRTATWPF
jgi:hypothetical protein